MDNKDNILEVQKIASLAKIKIDKKDSAKLAKNFAEVKNYFKELSLLDVEDVRLDSPPEMLSSHEDTPRLSGIKVSFSKYVEENMFKVPKVID